MQGPARTIGLRDGVVRWQAAVPAQDARVEVVAGIAAAGEGREHGLVMVLRQSYRLARLGRHAGRHAYSSRSATQHESVARGGGGALVALTASDRPRPRAVARSHRASCANGRIHPEAPNNTMRKRLGSIQAALLHQASARRRSGGGALVRGQCVRRGRGGATPPARSASSTPAAGATRPRRLRRPRKVRHAPYLATDARWRQLAETNSQ